MKRLQLRPRKKPHL